ncbi:MFS transporter [Amycolatopsis sp. CA-230715]|uniref:MFS transporter n=1 Tax=Amycolatopsis sp. CA-230715 TaxID=2745196 RepID=UPI001C01B8EC|nr:MFS transporter [Amycolatopsis sp. CA-230715]QWF77899.1 Putative multidrug resistance protein MdtD [Amycolatopsis sp. CA-230715]
MPARTAVAGETRTTALLTIVALVAFVATLDNTIVAAAAPSMGRELGLGLTALEWAGIAYMLPYAALMLPAGALIDRLGRRRVLLAGCGLFTAGALLGGAAWSAEILFVARGAQGIAAALVVPGTLSLIRTVLPAQRRPLAVAVWTAALAAALAAGPWLGGALAEYLHWSWIFLGTVPLLVAIAVLVAGAVPPEETRIGTRGRRGVPVRLLGNRVFVGANALVLLWGLGISGIAFFTPLLHQEFLGLGPQAAGLPLALVAVAVVGATPFVAPVSRALGTPRAVCLGLLVVAAGLVAVAVVNDQHALVPRFAGLLLIGAGSAFTAPITAYALDAVAEEDSGTASGLLMSSRELASALGVALIGTVLSVVRGRETAAGAEHGPALAAGYTAGLVVAAVLQAAAAALALVVLRERRALAMTTSSQKGENA